MSDAADAIITARGVTKRFGELKAVDRVDLEVGRREVVCLIGPSGSGKSTLLRCMSFLERYDEGEVLIEGRLLGYTRRPDGSRRLAGSRILAEVRRNVGMVFQQFNLWPHMTALQNVTLPLVLARGLDKAEARARAMAMLERVGLAEKGGSHPARLSGGQQQRVAIARALAMDPHIMLFDEPTSALDPELVGEVLAVIRDLARDGMTMVVVTHEMGFAAGLADRIAFLDQGRVRALGTPRAVFQDSDDPRVRQFVKNYLDRNAFWAAMEG